MSRLTLLQGLLLSFQGEIEPTRREYLPKEEAYAQLKFHTGQDFGDDIGKWEQWIREHPTSISSEVKKDVSSRVSRFLNS